MPGFAAENLHWRAEGKIFIRLVRNTKNNTGLSDGAVFQIEAAAVTTEKEFFYPNIKKNGVEQIILKANQRKKEKLFILDGNNKKSTVINQYNPLLDKNLYSYFNSQNNKNFLQINGFIKKDGEINYDPIYRETLGFSKIIKDEKDAYKSFQKSNKFLYGYRKKSPGYSIYNGTKEQIVLPPINSPLARIISIFTPPISCNPILFYSFFLAIDFAFY